MTGALEYQRVQSIVDLGDPQDSSLYLPLLFHQVTNQPLKPTYPHMRVDFKPEVHKVGRGRGLDHKGSHGNYDGNPRIGNTEGDRKRPQTVCFFTV